MGSFIDMSGQKYGYLTALSISHRNEREEIFWNCQCQCGSLVVIKGSLMRQGQTKSCGCYRKEVTSMNKKTHGMRSTRLYNVWNHMKRRCTEKNTKEYKNYGGRGITVCDEWENPQNFFEWAIANGYKDNLTIERINVNGNYRPDNCEFIPKSLQSKNRRYNLMIDTGGAEVCAAEAARMAGVSRKTVANWYHAGLIKTINDVKALANRKERKLCKR